MSQPNNNGIRNLLADCLALIRSWWRVDRIRVKPSEGRLLRLNAGSLILVGTRPVEVVGRRVRQNGTSVTVVYDCRCDDDEARLVVLSTSGQHCRLLSWFQGGRIRRIDETDVTVYR